MNTIVYEKTMTGRPHDISVQKATSDTEMWMQFNVMPRTHPINSHYHLSIGLPTQGGWIGITSYVLFKRHLNGFL